MRPYKYNCIMRGIIWMTLMPITLILLEVCFPLGIVMGVILISIISSTETKKK